MWGKDFWWLIFRFFREGAWSGLVGVAKHSPCEVWWYLSWFYEIFMEKPFSQFWGHTLYEGTNFEEKILSDTSCGISLTKFSISSYHLAKSENYCLGNSSALAWWNFFVENWHALCQQSRAEKSLLLEEGLYTPAPSTILRIMVVLLLKEDVR